MAEEINETEIETTDTDYIEAIKNLKENTVPKEKYDKLKSENKQLLDSLIKGESIEAAPKGPTDEELRKDLFGKNLNNLDFVSKALKLRENILNETGEDIFAPDGAQFSFSDEDRRDAQKVAEALQACIDTADGNSAIFTTELQRILKDTNIPKSRSR